LAAAFGFEATIPILAPAQGQEHREIGNNPIRVIEMFEYAVGRER
jgi:hypothetical protein